MLFPEINVFLGMRYGGIPILNIDISTVSRYEGVSDHFWYVWDSYRSLFALSKLTGNCETFDVYNRLQELSDGI